MPLQQIARAPGRDPGRDPAGTRRGAFRTALLTAAAAVAAAGVTQASAQTTTGEARADGLTDADILNFALNLEYLEAAYYAVALGQGGTGQGAIGQGMPPAPAIRRGARMRRMAGSGGPVPFSNPGFRQFAENLARDEAEHVRFLRGALGEAAVPQPAIDFAGGFRALARAAGLGPGFDPFADETSFFLGAFLFEDVGVTAYKGAAPLIANKDFLQAAAGIHAVEAYHGGMVRSVLYRMGPQARQRADAISAARDRLNAPAMLDQGVTLDGTARIAPSDGNGVAFGRTPQQVLQIVYLTDQRGSTSGGFFPNGVNGKIRST